MSVGFFCFLLVSMVIAGIIKHCLRRGALLVVVLGSMLDGCSLFNLVSQ
jgi:hypothetical protein